MTDTAPTTLTTADKITAIEESNYSLAWDGCHKIYLLGDQARISDAIATGYQVYSADEIRDLITGSCGLVFVSNWGLTDDKWDHDWTIDQGTDDIFHAADPDIAAPERHEETWRVLGGTKDYPSVELARAEAERLSAEGGGRWIGIEQQFTDGSRSLVESVGTREGHIPGHDGKVTYPDWEAPQEIVLGDYVATSTHGHRGRVYKVHPGYPAGHGCPESDSWLAGQSPEPLTQYKYERWISILVDDGGAVVVPSMLAHRVEPFPFTNRYANQYFRAEENA